MRGPTSPARAALLAGLGRRDDLPAVRRRVGDHRVADLARAPLARGARAAAAARASASWRSSASRVRSSSAALAIRGSGGFSSRGSARRLEVARVARELGLEAADLAPQLAPGAALVGLEPGVVELELGGEPLEVELGRRLVLGGSAGSSSRPSGSAGGDEGGDRDVARVDARLARRLDRLGGDPLDLGRARGASSATKLPRPWRVTISPSSSSRA